VACYNKSHFSIGLLAVYVPTMSQSLRCVISCTVSYS